MMRRFHSSISGSTVLSGVLLAVAAWSLSLTAAAGDDVGAASETVESPIVSAMRDRAVQTSLTVDVGGTEHPAEPIAQPVFRYSDQPRRIEDATRWVWTYESRLVAMQKIEAVIHLAMGKPEWQVCLTSLSVEPPIRARWREDREFQSEEPGLELRFDDRKVWSIDWVRPRPGHNYGRWTYFKTPRPEPSNGRPQDDSTKQ